MHEPRKPWGAIPSIIGGGAPAEGASRLADSPLVELLAFAFNHSFGGVLTLSTDAGEAAQICFRQGRVASVNAAALNVECVRQVLEARLPPEALIFAEQHAERQQLDILGAVEALRLLPSESLPAVRVELATRQVLTLCGLDGETRYDFDSGSPEVEGGSLLEPSLDPLSLILACIHEEPALERARRSVQAFEHEPLLLRDDRPVEVQHLNGVSRLWLECLARAPLSYAQLSRIRPAAQEQLTALVYALLITGQAAMKHGAADRARPMHHSRVPRSISSHARRAVPGAADAGSQGTVSGSWPSVRTPDGPQAKGHITPRQTPPRQSLVPPPPRPSFSSLPPRSDRAPVTPRTRARQEYAAEAKVVQAWMMAEADRSYLDKSRVFVGKVVQLFPHNPRIRYWYGCLQKRALRHDSAIEHFQSAVEMDPDHLDARDELEQLLAWRKDKRGPPPR